MSYIIDKGVGKFFPPATVFVGYAFLAGGIVLFLGNPLIGGGMALIGSFGAFGRSGFQINPEKRVFREYTALFGLRIETWKSLEGFSDVSVLRKKITTKAFSRTNRSATTSSGTFYEVHLLDSTHLNKHLIIRWTDDELAARDAQQLAATLGFKYGAYDPQISARSKARRR